MDTAIENALHECTAGSDEKCIEFPAVHPPSACVVQKRSKQAADRVGDDVGYVGRADCEHKLDYLDRRFEGATSGWGFNLNVANGASGWSGRHQFICCLSHSSADRCAGR